MAERKKKQAAVFAKDESTFVNGSSAKGANTTHKGKEKCSGTNQPRDENRTSGHDVQRSEQKQKSGQNKRKTGQYRKEDTFGQSDQQSGNTDTSNNQKSDFSQENNPYIKEKMDLDIQVSKLKLMKANHTSQKYRLEDNITKHYPQQITILKERISGMQTDIQTAKENLPADKEQFTMKVGDKLYTDKKEAGTALVEMCKEIKSVNAPAMIGEYAGFKMSVSFDSFNHKFVMNVKGQLSHNLEIGSDPLGNIARINHALESMPKELAEAKTKLNNVEHQLETAKVEVQKPFAQEEELAEKLDRLSALNALLNMDEKGDDGIGMDDDTPEQGTERTGTFGQDVNQSARQNGLKSERVADKPVQRVSLKERLAEMKIKATGNSMEKSGNRDKRKEEFL